VEERTETAEAIVSKLTKYRYQYEYFKISPKSVDFRIRVKLPNH